MISELFQSLLGNLWSVVLIVLFFSSSIFVHELGHFLAARLRGVKVVRFSIGMGPAIWSHRAKDGVEYRIAWFPFGGYVLLPQLADMAAIEGESDVDVESLPPVTYGTKLLVFVAGAAFNVIFAFVLATVLWFTGRPEPESLTSTRIGYVSEKLPLPDKTLVTSPASKAGLKEGDRIVAIDGAPMHNWMDILNAIVLSTRVNDAGERVTVLTIERGGVTKDYLVNPIRTGDENFRKIGIEVAYAVMVKAVVAGSPASKIGFEADDQIIRIDGKQVWGIPSLATNLSVAKGTKQVLTVSRAGREVELPFISPGAEETSYFKGLELSTKWQLLYQTPVEQITMFLRNSAQTLTALIHPQGDVGLKNLSGFIGIGRGFWDALKSDHPAKFVIWFTVMINISLAFFNLLPIPVLDGGHIVLATITKLRGRPLPAELILTTQSVFMVLLLAMMLYVTVFGDIRRLVTDYRASSQAREAAEKQKPAPDGGK